MLEFKYTVFPVELCEIILVASKKGIAALHLQTGEGRREFIISDSWEKDDNYFVNERKQIDKYFAGKLQKFAIKIDLQGTVFQQKVWQALCAIPYGEVRSYKDISMIVKGNGRACRAVGMANSKNPIPLIVPCHRVIGINGKLVGFAQGLAIKKKLLALESMTKNKA